MGCPLPSAPADMPNMIYWDWMHCWASNGGVGRYHVNQLIRRLSKKYGVTWEQWAKFAGQVKGLGTNTKRTFPTDFFKCRIVDRDDAAMKGFASEFLDIVAVVGLFVNSVVRPHGILAKEIECFDNMARILDIYRRRDFADLARLEIATERHHFLFMELYPN